MNVSPVWEDQRDDPQKWPSTLTARRAECWSFTQGSSSSSSEDGSSANFRLASILASFSCWSSWLRAANSAFFSEAQRASPSASPAFNPARTVSAAAVGLASELSAMARMRPKR